MEEILYLDYFNCYGDIFFVLIHTLVLRKPSLLKKTFTFERHHIYINDKLTIDVNRLALVMHKDHKALEGKTDLVLDLIHSSVV